MHKNPSPPVTIPKVTISFGGDTFKSGFRVRLSSPHSDVSLILNKRGSSYQSLDGMYLQHTEYSSLVADFRALQAVKRTQGTTPLIPFELSLPSLDAMELYGMPKDPNFKYRIRPKIVATSIDLSKRLPKKLLDVLMPFQQDGVRFCVACGGKALIADDPGCGKTIQAISTAVYFSEKWPLLIISPSAVCLNWKDELIKWVPSLDEKNVTVVSTNKISLPHDVLERRKTKGGVSSSSSSSSSSTSKTIVIISYNILTSLFDDGKIKSGDFPAVVVDECHMLKNPDAKRTKAIMSLLSEASVKLLLSGTPLLNRPKDLFTQLSCIDKTLFPNYDSFARRYCGRKAEFYGFNDDGKDNEKELSLLVFELVGIRHLKRDVLKSLPIKNRRKESVQVAEDAKIQLRQLQKRKDELSVKAKQTRDTYAKAALSRDIQQLISQMHMVMGIGKAPGVLKHILSVLKPLPGQNFIKAVSEAPPSEPRNAGDIRSHFGADDEIEEIENIEIEEVVAEDEMEKRGGKKNDHNVLNMPAFFEAGAMDTSISTSPLTIKGKVITVGSNFKRKRGVVETAVVSELHSGAPPQFHYHSHQQPEVDLATEVLNLVSPTLSLHSDKTADTEIVLSLSDEEISQKSSSSSSSTSSSTSLLSPTTSTLKTIGATTGAGAIAASTTASNKVVTSSNVAYGKTDADGKTTKLVVFAHHSQVLNYLEEGLIQRGIKIVRIDGKVTPARKHKLKASFQEDPSVQVALVSVTAAGVGISFVAASMSIFAELHWTPGVLLQAEDRIHRIGQTAPGVTITYLLGDKVPDSSDLVIWRVLEDKINAIEEIINAGRTIPEELLGKGDDEEEEDGSGGGGGGIKKSKGGGGGTKRTLTEIDEFSVPTDIFAALVGPDSDFFQMKGSKKPTPNLNPQLSIGDFFKVSSPSKGKTLQLETVLQPAVRTNTVTLAAALPSPPLQPLLPAPPLQLPLQPLLPAPPLQPLLPAPPLQPLLPALDDDDLIACLDRIDAELATKAAAASSTSTVMQPSQIVSTTVSQAKGFSSSSSSSILPPPLAEIDDDELNKLLDQLE
jgi:SNF2 family DNA or RNA helicase